MSDVKNGLLESLVKIAVEDPNSANGRFCIEQFAAELSRRAIAGFDPSTVIAADPRRLTSPHGLFLVATLHGNVIGSAALGFDGSSGATLHRMWVDPSTRGLGIGKQLIDEIEKKAHDAGFESIRLETNSALHEAIALYRRCGYVEINAFSHDSPADHWFEKRLI